MSSHPLDDLPDGHAARIVAIEGDDSLSLRIMEMGLVEGERIRRCGAAPLGDPLEFEIYGGHISLRRSEARRVIVAPESA
jgi:Fe2+ transport system protein FeoA